MNETALVLAFGVSFLVGLTGAVSPGPLLALAIREAARRGFPAGPYVSTGHAFMELLLVLLLLAGLGPFFRRPGVSAIIGILGGAFLLWMAWSMARHPQQAPSNAVHEQQGPRALGHPVMAGALVTLSNPFWFLWWMTAGAALMARSYVLGALGITAFYLGHITADYWWYSTVSFLIATGRRFMSPRVYGGIMLVCAVFLAGMGGYFIFSGWAALR